MADDDVSGDDGVDPTIRDRNQAQGAAADLARMGIDPRSLGLGEPQAPRSPAPEPADLESRAPVVFLRPELDNSPNLRDQPAPEPDQVVAAPSELRAPAVADVRPAGTTAPARSAAPHRRPWPRHP
ncbi:hypothetical protein [Aeromicrobium sp. UC242_57]|uniref:hypothetical protein n=1 Tax=Aeromicrobium sp. UC242_57 TaxID=3374624 RepID=UPI00379E1333